MSASHTAVISLLGAALAATAAQAAEPLKTLGQPEGRLDIIAWPGYIERGDTDPQYDWVTAFEKSTGCQVNVKTAGTSDEMVSLMSKGGYDLVTASGDASLRLVAGKHVQPVNITLIPSWNSVDDRLKNAPWHTVDGVHYGTPYQWGPNVLMYNTKIFPSAPTSWATVFEAQNLPDGKPNKGRVQAYDGPIYIADAALYLKSAKPELGIADPYLLDQKQYAAALALLRQQHSLIHRYWHDVTVQMNDFKNEGVVASSAWPYQVNALKAEGQPIASVVPKEGATGWADTTMLHATPGIRCAPTSGWTGRCNPRSRATWPPGSARCRQCRRPARATHCWAPRAARPTASTTSRRSPSGRRHRRRAASTCPTAAGPRTTSRSWAAGDGAGSTP